MADNRNTLTDEILVLAETLGDIKARFERVESEFAIQSRPLEAALAALSAAMTGIKTLQHHVLDNSLSALSLKVEEQRKAIDDQINVIVSELKGADAQNSEKIALQTAELKQQFSEICANVQQLSSQFDAQIKRVELEAKEQITKFAAVTGPQGPAGASFNPKGNWQEGVFYQRLDVVSLLGTSYVSNVDNNASKPTKNSDKWTVLAARAGNVGGGGAGNFASLAGIAEVSQGGTGITQYAIGDILYANDTGSLARLPAGVNGQFLKTTGAGGAPEWETPTGGGDVVGPASATDNALVRFDGTSGTAIQNSNATLTDAGALTLASNLTVSGTGNSVFRGPIRWGNTSWPGYNGYISEAATDSALNPAIARNLIGSTGSNYTIADGQLGYYSGFELGTDIRWFAASGTFTTGQSLVPTERMRLTYSGNLLIGTPTDVGAKVYSKVADGVLSFGAAGTTKGIRFAHASTYSSIDGVDSSLSGSYQPLQINGSTVQIATNGGTVAASFDTSQNATFAGTVTAVGISTFKRSDNTGSIRVVPTSGVSAGSDLESFNLSTLAYGRLNTRGTHLQVYTGTNATTLALTVDDSQNATFAGTVAVQGTAARIYSGTGSPEGVVTAATGSIYLNLSGGNNTTFYVKQSGSGNTGWNAK